MSCNVDALQKCGTTLSLILHLLNTHILLTFGNQEGNYAIACPVQDLLENPSSTLETLHRNNRPFNHCCSILGVCNGLVCLQDHCVVDEFEEYWVRIWNPATRVMSKDSPHICLQRSDYKDDSWFMFGFGHDESSDTYQVLFLDYNKNESQKLEVSVWSLGDTCWRNTLTCDAFPTVIGRESRGTFGTFVSGTLNWLAFPKSYYGYVRMNQLEIFSYNLKNETCKYLPMPDGILEVYVCNPELEVLKGCLYLCHHYEGNFIVWVKREFKVQITEFKLRGSL